jgi:hypothetical protein
MKLKRLRWLPAAALLTHCLLPPPARAAVVLTGTSYTETFDNLGAGLPSGWSVRTGATATSAGSAQAFSTAEVTWALNTGGFRNVASADGLSEFALDSQQHASADRALGVRQGGTFGGDPGAAFAVTLQNTAGLENFQLSLKAQLLDLEARSTTWSVQYQVGSGSFVTLGTWNDPGAFGSTTLTYNLGSALNDRSEQITFRIAALTASTGSGSRDTFAIDDFTLTYSEVTPVPEPIHFALLSALGLLVLCVCKSRRRA